MNNVWQVASVKQMDSSACIMWSLALHMSFDMQCACANGENSVVTELCSLFNWPGCSVCLTNRMLHMFCCRVLSCYSSSTLSDGEDGSANTIAEILKSAKQRLSSMLWRQTLEMYHGT